MGFAPTWLRQVSPLLHVSTLTSESETFRTAQSSTVILLNQHDGLGSITVRGYLRQGACMFYSAFFSLSVRNKNHLKSADRIVTKTLPECWGKGKFRNLDIHTPAGGVDFEGAWLRAVPANNRARLAADVLIRVCTQAHQAANRHRRDDGYRPGPGIIGDTTTGSAFRRQNLVSFCYSRTSHPDQNISSIFVNHF